MRRFAIIPTYQRERSLWRLLRSLDVPPENIAVINNGPRPLTRVAQHGLQVINWPERPPNIQRMWNIGLAWAAREAQGDAHAVLVLNDDVEARGLLSVPLAEALEQSGATIAYPTRAGVGHLPWVLRRCQGDGPLPFTPDGGHRMSGWCWMVRGDTLRADERFEWWYGDNDLEWRAQQLGGTVEVAGVSVLHHHPNEQTAASPALRAQTRRDRAAFLAKWGRLP